MSDKGEKTCPLCAEEMDLTDQQLKPCKCGFEICVWCWHHIMEMADKDTEARCPACRSTYNKEKIVGMAANCERLVAEVNAERKQKSQKAKPKPSEARNHLNDIRVLKRNLVYITGLPPDLADEDRLQRRDYFGQYGKVLKVSISKTASGAVQHSSDNSCSVYITYSKEEEAVCCIQSVHSFVLQGRSLRAYFGTTKYCHSWLRNVPCNVPDCFYLHDYGSQEDSFAKDDIVSAFARSKEQQTIGASNNLHRGPGNVLPPPVTECGTRSKISSAKPVGKTYSNTVGNQSRDSCVDGSTGTSTVLPTTGSWVMCASASLSAVPNMSSSVAISNNKPDPYPGSEVVSTKTSAHDVRRTVQAEEIREIHSHYRTDTLEISKDYLNCDYQTCTSNRKVGTLSSLNSGSLICGADTLASKGRDTSEAVKTESSLNYCSKSSGNTFGSDHGSFIADGAFQDLSSICTLSHTENEDFVPVLPDSSVPTHTSCSLPKSPSFRGDTNEQNFSSPRFPTQSKFMTVEDLLDFNDQQPKGLEDICDLPSASCSISLRENLSQSSFNPCQKGEIKHQPDLLAHSRTVHVQDKVLFPLTYENLVSSSGLRYSNMSWSGDGNCTNDVASVENSCTSDAGEDSIISKIISMELDPCDDSLTSADNLAKLLNETKEQRASVIPPSLRKDNNQSRFSFARQEDFGNQASCSDDTFGSMPDLKNYTTHHDFNAFNDLSVDKYQTLSSNFFEESNTRINNRTFAPAKCSASIPPGFSVPSRAPPPGFLNSGRMRVALDSAASHLLQSSEPQISFGCSGDVEFLDPAILEVGKGGMALRSNKSGFDTGTSAPRDSSFDHDSCFDTRPSAPCHSNFNRDARLQLLMQQTLCAHQNLALQDHSRNRISQSNDTYSMSPVLLDQSPAYNPFSFPQSTIQQLTNAQMSNGPVSSWNEVKSCSDLRLSELLKNGGLGFNKYTASYEDLKCQVSSSSNLYNRGFAM